MTMMMYKIPGIKIADGSIEALKWLAMVAMTLDHMNRIFFNPGSIVFYSIGRIAMPIFAFVFVYNFARSTEFVAAHYYKSCQRLLLFGVLATPAYLSMMHIHGLIPLNIMFTLLVAAATLFFYEKEGLGARAIVCFFVGGVFVEYSWYGIFICLTSWFYCKTPNSMSLLGIILAFILLDGFNQSDWTLMAIPIILLASRIDFKVPRARFLFWVYYPLHLSVMILIKEISPYL